MNDWDTELGHARRRWVARATAKLERSNYGSAVTEPIIREAWWANRAEGQANTALFQAARDVVMARTANVDVNQMTEAFLRLSGAVADVFAVIQGHADPDQVAPEDPFGGIGLHPGRLPPAHPRAE